MYYFATKKKQLLQRTSGPFVPSMSYYMLTEKPLKSS